MTSTEMTGEVLILSQKNNLTSNFSATRTSKCETLILPQLIRNEIMAYPPRRPTSAKDKAEAMFKTATTRPEEAPVMPKKKPIPVGKETITISIDNDVLAYFQDGGVGWRDRLNEALRKAAGLD